MSENVYKFINRRQVEQELHVELLQKLDRCLELTMMLENVNSFGIDYKGAGNAIYHAFVAVENLPEEA
jgi:hypothetical protein